MSDINEFSANGPIPSLSSRINKDVLFNVLKIMKGNPGLDHKLILEVDGIYQMDSPEKKARALSEWIKRIESISSKKEENIKEQETLYI
jgi:hypothetical protein